jgi:hypothetical protein
LYSLNIREIQTANPFAYSAVVGVRTNHER